MSKGKKPQRTCVFCRNVAEKDSLIRIVRLSGGGIAVDESGCKNGRGAYVCRAPECWEGALNKGSLDRALKTPLKSAEKEQLKHTLEVLGSKE